MINISNVTKFLLLAFSLGLTCLLIVYFKRVADTGFGTTNIALDKLSQYEIELSESDLTMYDGIDITGSDVVNFIKKHLGSYAASEQAAFYVYVRTQNTEQTYQNGAYLTDIQDFTSTLYIKPVNKFQCGIVRDANKVIVGVKFQQR